MKPLLGIDFGTTTSRAALVTGGKVILLEQTPGAYAIPSVVAFPPAAAGGGPPLVGAAALAAVGRQPERTIAAVKRLLGRKLEAPEVRHQRLAMPYELVAARNGDTRVRVGRRHHAPQDIAAYILDELRDAAERQAGEPVTEAVLAVPALFDDLQRQALRDAARIAGFEVQGVVTQASASLLGSGIYPVSRGDERRVLVYDLGGGSFEVAALSVTDLGVNVLATGGDAFLGGADFDQRIVAFVCEEMLKADGTDLRKDRALLARLGQVAERAKIELSATDVVDIHIPKAASRAATIRLERARLETLTQDLVDRTVWACEAVLRDARWEPSDVDVILLLGGQARMPRVRAHVGDVFGRSIAEVTASESLAALGAAQQAAALGGVARRGRGARNRALVSEVSSLSLGFEAAGGVFTRLVPKGTALPASMSQTLSTAADGQTQVILHLLQGDREMAADNESVARFQIGPLPARPRGEIQIEVEIVNDGGGLPTVAARDAATGETKQVRMRPSGGLSEAEIVALTAVHAGKAGTAAVLAAEAADEAAAVVAAAGDGSGTGKVVARPEAVDPTVPGG